MINKSERGYTFTVKYPLQKYGTKITVDITDGNGGSASETYTMDYYINYNITVEDKDVQQTQITGTTKSDTTYDRYGIIKEETIFTVAAKIGDKTYDGTVSGHNFTVTYPKQDFGTKVTILVTDRCGGRTSEKTFEIANCPPQLKVDKVSYNSTYITGKTEPNLEIQVAASNKKYQGQADSKGNFKIKIPAQKINTKITVECTSDTGYFNSKDITVVGPSCGVVINDEILKNTSKITGSVTGGIKGDYLVIKIGSKSYKKVLKTAKKQTFKITVKNPVPGQKVTVTLYNKFKQKRYSSNSKVYLALKPTIGMTKKQVLQTTWGSSDYVSKFNVGGVSYEQWGYEIKNKFTYLWFEKGILKSINSYSYKN
ncbi:hypothetical protein EDD66_10870 [Mobilisporobacter senegalensis]|uniref:Bacterial Ig domain-containing protein n=1 Tax=Mobilisporobacter senegalensis TaxID=1329262 RepID=A0A3N1XJT5_9FIRM|nr:Ig-like domain-containing protein [Mobilisporobacter senegalensis]ROR26348.1 hypothetical protein EDD66_10870 [Mobilisporobacter senegalensis]